MGDVAISNPTVAGEKVELRGPILVCALEVDKKLLGSIDAKDVLQLPEKSTAVVAPKPWDNGGNTRP